MDPGTGKLYEVSSDRAARKRGLVPVERVLTPYERKTRKIGRNEPCVCGSGKKFKHCHLVTGQPPSEAPK